MRVTNYIVAQMQCKSIESSAISFVFEFENTKKAFEKSELMMKRDLILDGKKYVMNNLNFKNPFIVLLQ